MLSESTLPRLKSGLGLTDQKINALANHLIVIFIVTMPILVSVRRLSLVLLFFLFLIRGRIAFYVGECLKDPLIKAFSLYFIVHIIWLPWADDYATARSVVHDATFLLIPLLFCSFIDKRYIPRMLGAFVIGMLVSELVSFGIFLELIPPMVHYGNQGVPDDPTPVYHHTHYGFMLATALMLAIIILLSGIKHKKIVAMLSVFSVLTLLNIFITGGRSGYVLLLVYVPALIVLKYRRNSLKPLALSSVFLALVFATSYQLSDIFQQKVDMSVSSVEKIIDDGYLATSIGGRIGIVKYALPIITENWLLGIGTGDHVNAVEDAIKVSGGDLSVFFDSLGHLHNEYISALIQFGIIGLLVYLNIIYSLLNYRSDRSEIALMYKGLALGIVVFTTMDILVLGLGMLFTVVVLVSLGQRQYIIGDAGFQVIRARDYLYYGLATGGFYIVQLVIP